MAKPVGDVNRTINARARFVRISPYKVRAVTSLIKGKHVDEARRILAFTPKAASREVSKVLESAIANAEHNFQIPQQELIVKVAKADEGATIKRIRPRAQGRAFRILKRTSHIDLILERQPEALTPGKGAEKPRRPRRKTEAAAPVTGAKAKAGGRKPSAKKAVAKKPPADKTAAKAELKPEMETPSEAPSSTEEGEV